MKSIILIISTIFYSTGLMAGVFYVDNNHSNTSDSNAGTESSPWETVSKAMATAKAGDTVYIKRGDYRSEPERIDILNSGSSNAWIKFKAYPGDEHEAVLHKTGIKSEGNSYILIEGIKLVDTPSYGIRFNGPKDNKAPPVSNIIIRNVHTHKTCSSAIAIWGVDWKKDPGNYDNIKDVIIEHNLLEYGTTGCKNEIITVANGASNIQVRFNEIRWGDPNYEGGDEGIDFKEGVINSSIHGNYMHHLADKAIYLDGGSADFFPNRDPQVSNIHIYDNVITDIPSAGMAIQTEGRGDTKDIFIYNNIVANTTGDGYRIYDHPGGVEEGGTVSNVYFYNNIAYNTGKAVPYFELKKDANGITPTSHSNRRHKARAGGSGFENAYADAKNIVFVNNISVNNGDKGFDIENPTNSILRNNLCSQSICDIRSDPLFLDPLNMNFRLKSRSPAIGKAIVDDLLNSLKKNPGFSRGFASDIGVLHHDVGMETMAMAGLLKARSPKVEIKEEEEGITPPIKPALALPAPDLSPIRPTPPGQLTSNDRLIPVRDASVNQVYPLLNYGKNKKLKVDEASEREESYMVFDLSKVNGDIKGLTLILNITNESNSGPLLHMANSQWKEGLVTWKTKPKLGKLILELPPLQKGLRKIELPVDSIKDNILSIAFIPSSRDGMDFSSKEGSIPPRLIVNVQGNKNLETKPLEPTPIPLPELPNIVKSMKIQASGDATISQKMKYTNYGSKGFLSSDLGSILEHTLVKFNVKGIRGKVKRAKVRLFVTNKSRNAPYIVQSDSNWDENKINWKNRPILLGKNLSNLKSISRGEWVEYDVTLAIQKDGEVSFTLIPESKDGADFASRESRRPPQLIVEYGASR